MNLTEYIGTCSDKMLAVMKAIAFIRKTKELAQRAKLVVAEVERVSAAYSSDKKPVLKGNWTTKRARAEWLDIKKAIEGTLKPDDHLVWQTINSCSDTLVDHSGVFASKFKQYETTIKNLEDEKKQERKKHDDLYELCLKEQYRKICEDDVIGEVIADSDNIRKESRIHIKTIQEYQKMVKKYEMDNDKYLRREALPGAVDKAKYRLFQPDFSLINTQHADGDLKIFYVTQVLSSMYEGVKIQIDKKRPEDIVFVYHHFNIEDIHFFIEKTVPFRFEDNNIVIACHDPNSESRRSNYKLIAETIRPIKPRVIIVESEKQKQSGSETPSNVVKLHGDAEDRIKTVFAKARCEFDVVKEGYDSVLIKRV